LDTGEYLELLYKKYHKPQYIPPDPLEFPRKYSNREDREIVALIASSLAMGRVSGIKKAVDSVLTPLSSPREALLNISEGEFKKLYRNFSYRFFRGEHISALLTGIAETIREYGTLESCFMEGYLKSQKSGSENLFPALERFVRILSKKSGGDMGFILPAPEKGGACKRLNLFLRWMVRSDSVDPGGWVELNPSALLVPLDTHMLKNGRALGLTSRRQADRKTTLEITESFRKFDPEDPVRYDFSLTRLGIHPTVRSRDNPFMPAGF